ncbi:hypothetical protein ACFFRR_008723 [Megaselia abdita]
MTLFTILLCILNLQFVFPSVLRTWGYTFISLDIEYKKTDWLFADIKLVKIKKGDYAINGTFIFKKDITMDFLYSLKLFRSPRGNDDYKPLPFSVPQQNLETFFNGVYKDVVMEDLHKCTNLPYFQDRWNEPLKAQEYYLNMCQFNVDNWPDYLPNGFYKFDTKIYFPSGDVFVSAIATEEIEQTGLIGK